MQIKSTQFDMTDPFAELKQRASRAQTLLRQLPPAQRKHVMTQLVQTLPAPRTSCTGSPVTMVTFEIERWDGGASIPSVPPALVRMPRRRFRQIPWQWRVIMTGIRVTRRLRKSVRKPLRRMIHVSRRFLHRHFPGAYAARRARFR